MVLTSLVSLLAAASSTLLLVAPGPVAAEDRLTCGDATYFPSEYKCYDNRTLCPIQFSLPTKPCAGSGGCYPPEQFSCEAPSGKGKGKGKKEGEGKGILRTLPEATSPFTLTVWGTRQTFRNQTVKACGGYLAIGANARQCHACTAVGGTDCGKYANVTALLPHGRMNSGVANPQYWYVDPLQGVLRYTDPIASNTTEDGDPVWGVEFAGKNVKVYENGFFVWDREDAMSHFWMACLITLPGGGTSTGRSWRLYAPTGMNLERGDCELVRIVAKAVDKNSGVYQYL
ncbi:hypothetical protein VTJ83DRAFT_73 [Remersonia thermophila]|uniref:Endo-1,3(4)-beta-glucanase 1 carbohydrate binding domain-containing protein n=1 Tax=Remersonia thermophila TaxID=72144 RepID=A0ABR4DK80_9PEZI